MHTITKRLGTFGLAIMFCLCINTIVNAQSPADDPGINGPGSPNNGPSGDGSPVVPFDGRVSLVLAAAGILFASKKIKDLKVC